MEVVKPQISIDQNVKNIKIEEKTINKDAVSILRLTPKYKRSKMDQGNINMGLCVVYQ